MRKNIGLGAFLLLVVGTLGLLLNELVFAWGRPAQLGFALLNVVGLALLSYSRWHRRRCA